MKLRTRCDSGSIISFRLRSAKCGQILNAKLRGHYQYYGINDNWPLLMAYRSKVRRMAKRHLSRRSQKSYVNWDALQSLHRASSPGKSETFDGPDRDEPWSELRVPSEIWEPDAVTRHVRIYEGSGVNWAWKEYCDTTNGKPVANSEHKPYPKPKRPRSTHPEPSKQLCLMVTSPLGPGDREQSGNGSSAPPTSLPR